MKRAADLRSDYELLGELMAASDTPPAAAAAIARERRIIGELLEMLESPEEATVADQLAERRRAKSSTSRSSTGG